MTLQTISASRIKTYRTCARQYYYKYVLHKDNRPEQDKNIGALLGTALHKAIELTYKENANPIAVFEHIMATTFDEWETAGYTIRGEEWFSKSRRDGRKILKEFDWEQWQPIELELNFTLPFPNASNPIVNINGIIDVIDTRGYIVDHKSQRKTPSQDEMDNDPQFILYAWAYRALYGVLPIAVYWNNLRTNTAIEVNVLREFDMKLQQLALDIEAQIAATQYARRTLDRVCKTECSFYSLCYGTKHKDVIIEEDDNDNE